MVFPESTCLRSEQRKKHGWCTIILIIASFALLSWGLLISGGNPLRLQTGVLCGAGVLLALSIYYGWQCNRALARLDSGAEPATIGKETQYNQAIHNDRIQAILLIIGVWVFIGGLFA